MSRSGKGPTTDLTSVEWDHNSTSSKCILCSTAWGTFRNRRHHCRKCGRLVCEACSLHR
ncbi:hypothetical protein B484DRAFT_334498, partial [Ochromonadaceae sp. CCMP2298]